MAHAALDKASIKKPSRGNYQMIGDEGAARRGKIENARKPVAAKKMSFKNIDTPFTFTYPSTWEIFSNKDGVSATRQSDFVPMFQRKPTIIFSASSIAQGKTYSLDEIDTYFSSHVNMSDSELLVDWYIPSFQLIQSGSSLLAKQPAMRYEYTGEIQSIKYKIALYIASLNGKLYFAEFMAIPSEFDANISIFNEALKTLKIVDKSTTQDQPRKRVR